jgi:hypothetical protein
VRLSRQLFRLLGHFQFPCQIVSKFCIQIRIKDVAAVTRHQNSFDTFSRTFEVHSLFESHVSSQPPRGSSNALH